METDGVVDTPRLEAAGDDVYMIGDFDGNIFLYNSNQSITPITRVSVGGLNGILVKYSSAGVAQWAAQFATPGDCILTGISLSGSGYVHVSGRYDTATELFNSDGIASGIELPNIGLFDVLVAKYDSDGVLQWGTHLGSLTNDFSLGIDVATDDSVYVSGSFTGDPLTIFNSNETIFGTLTRTGTQALFLVKYDEDGQGIWSTKVQSTTTVSGSISNTSVLDKDVYVLCNYGGVPSIYNSDGSLSTVTLPIGNQNGVIKYNSLGFAVWAASITNLTDPSLFVSNMGDVFVTTIQTATVITVFNSDQTQAFVVPFTVDGSALIKYHDEAINNYTLGAPYNNGLTKLILANSPTTVTSTTPLKDGTSDAYTLISFETSGTSIELVYNLISNLWIITSISSSVTLS
jgi:hypothetical protein